MSELMNARANKNDFHWRLLTTVSAAALLASVCAASQAKAADGTPPLWIELGGQFAQQETDQDAFLPPFVVATPRPAFAVDSPTQIEKQSPWSGNGTAKIVLEPEANGWVFSAGILYGRSSRKQSVNQLTPNLTNAVESFGRGTRYIAYQRITAKNSESHTLLDFQVGRDVGLGMFGNHSSSIISLGLRYAQFNVQRGVTMVSQPTNVSARQIYHRFYATSATKRKFTGVGPSLSWDASADLIGNRSTEEMTFDWGLNGAVLFGRQRAQGHHQTTNMRHDGRVYYGSFIEYPRTIIYQHAAPLNRNKQMIVPNLGGFVGASWRYPSAKVTLGYRADFFFGGMDGGVDAAHRENVGFYGPFASISIGFGG
jgi:iron complex outermembrane recepter protein